MQRGNISIQQSKIDRIEPPLPRDASWLVASSPPCQLKTAAAAGSPRARAPKAALRGRSERQSGWTAGSPRRACRHRLVYYSCHRLQGRPRPPRPPRPQAPPRGLRPRPRAPPRAPRRRPPPHYRLPPRHAPPNATRHPRRRAAQPAGRARNEPSSRRTGPRTNSRSGPWCPNACSCPTRRSTMAPLSTHRCSCSLPRRNRRSSWRRAQESRP
mmetsp:Transcript_68508/g.182289  ORF Transcript_68508/g.182289 Transcript_68508/m.182289 type:complete len:213 (-) Transcript_68508:603-1241(-)